MENTIGNKLADLYEKVLQWQTDRNFFGVGGATVES